MVASDNSLCSWLGDNKTIENKDGAQEYYDSIFSLYASWGLDFVKVDDLSNPYHKEEIEMIRRAIDKCGRKIVFSMSPGETPIAEAAHAKSCANMWRIVPDLWDEWGHVKNLIEAAARWVGHGGYGTYPDCDMLPLGRIGIRAERGTDRSSRLAKDEQYSLMNLMLICKSPLMFGGDLPSCDEFTMSLLTNKAALKIHRGSKNPRVVKNGGDILVIASTDKTGKRHNAAIFNKTDSPLTAEISEELFPQNAKIADAWSGEFLKGRTVELPPRGSILLTEN